MTTTRHLAFGVQLRLLIESTAREGDPADSIRSVAAAIGISDQTLLNLLDGSADSPRIDTVRKIRRHFGITLDYFDCETEAECRAYLAQRRIDAAAPVIHTIEAETEGLSARGKRNILSLIEWLRRGRKRK